MCYHTHSSPNESIDCVVRCKIYRFIRRGMCVITQSFLIGFQRIDSQSLQYVNKNYRFMRRKRVTSTQSFHTLCAAQNIQIHLEKWGFFFKLQNIHFSWLLFGLKIAFLQKSLNQKVQFSTNIRTMQKKPFAKMVRILISLNRLGNVWVLNSDFNVRLIKQCVCMLLRALEGRHNKVTWFKFDLAKKL